MFHVKHFSVENYFIISSWIFFLKNLITLPLLHMVYSFKNSVLYNSFKFCYIKHLPNAQNIFLKMFHVKHYTYICSCISSIIFCTMADRFFNSILHLMGSISAILLHISNLRSISFNC